MILWLKKAYTEYLMIIYNNRKLWEIMTLYMVNRKDFFNDHMKSENPENMDEEFAEEAARK